MASEWGVSPKQSVLAEVRRRGTADVVSHCAAILSGDGVDPEFLFVLAGPASRQILEGREGGLGGYWPKVWALRALLYAWDDAAAGSVIDATGDVSWRVREMAARVIRAHAIDDALEVLGRLADDAVPRVRAAADRARVSLVETAPRRSR
ncbi:MAG TPA: hypothetical protein VND62_03570 [Acidimicrobiales bacterium]|nr:hypothetical protein [Acidimicrobiales bacterium]